jgi:hypothetical protein
MKIITKPKLKLELNKTEARGIRKVYQGMLELIEDPKHWVQGTYKTKEQGYPQYCLIGAAREVDGKWEDLATAFMFFHLPSGPYIELKDYYDPECDKLALSTIKEAGHDGAVIFNDDYAGHRDVLKWLRALIKKTDKIIAA